MCYTQNTKKGGVELKKLLMIIVLAMLIVPAFGTVVYGAENNSLAEDIQLVDNYVHAQIDAAINNEHSIAEKLQSDLAKTNNDEEILKLNKEYNEALDGIIDHLLYTTGKKVDELIAKYEKQNVFLEKYWIPVTIGGRDILVDPIRVLP